MSDTQAADLVRIASYDPAWPGEELAFRDALRAEPETAQAYEELKRQLADEHTHDRQAYTVAKSEFVEAVLARVL